MGIAVVGVVTAAVVTVPLILLGSSGSGKDESRAADSTRTEDKDKAPSKTHQPPPPHSTAGALPQQPGSASTTGAPNPKEPTKPAEPTIPPKSRDGSGIPSGEGLIRNKKYGFCLDLPGTAKSALNTSVLDGACRPSGGDNQEWVLDTVSKGGGTGGADLYLIHNAKSGLCLDLYGDGPAEIASPAGLFGCSPSKEDNQLWWLDKRPDGTYWIRNQRSGDMCLDVARTNKKAAHTNVTLFPCSDLDDHEWSFSKG
ncbi:RICIN domain-containing protein [Streptomyces aurantiacus]|uniref:RICIN domain-containing protein n=1 Tax=Streptomyces aurantiacus TaxID=47760 RepID=UPI0027D91D5B|nr:RICIN domain-containing protein [Streptomyces aurantiacus]